MTRISSNMANANNTSSKTGDINERQQSLKCQTCGKKGKKGCTQSLCLKCCTDDACLVHKEQREQVFFRKQVMNGATPIQLQAKEKRSKVIIPKKSIFREPGFSYLSDTVVIWDMREYLNNPKWKEDALKSNKRRRQLQTEKPIHGSRRKRFRRVVEELYQKSLMENQTGTQE